MIRLLPLLLVMIFACSTSKSQQVLSAKDKDDHAQITKVIQQLFDGMRAGDSSMVSPLFRKDAKLFSTFYRKGKTEVSEENIAKFIEFIGTPHKEIFDEKIWSYDIKVDAPLATAWTEYTFYVGKKMSHCGVNAFQLIKENGTWKIHQIIDTRKRENCKTE